MGERVNRYTVVFLNILTPSAWVNSVGGPSYVGGYAECDISRSSSSWHLQCRDYVVENGLF
jgi:hypothetical protein